MERVDLGEVPYDDAMRQMAGWVGERRAGTQQGIPMPGEAQVRDAIALHLQRPW